MLKRKIEPTSTTKYAIGPISANDICFIVKVAALGKALVERRFLFVTLTSFFPRLQGGISGNVIYKSQL